MFGWSTVDACIIFWYSKKSMSGNGLCISVAFVLNGKPKNWLSDTCELVDWVLEMLLDFQGLHIARHPSFLRDVGEYQSHCKKQKKRQLVCNFEVFCGSALFLRSLPPCPNKIGLKVLKLNADPANLQIGIQQIVQVLNNVDPGLINPMVV